MRLSLPAGIALALCVATQSHAASSDLIFCSKQQDRSERLACYEAAARIAERSLAIEARTPPTVSNRQKEKRRIEEPMAAFASGAPVKAAAALLPERSPFQGTYATFGGSYGVTEAVFSTFDGTRVTPHGPSVVGSFGYNHQIGAFVMGLEGSWRYGWERGESSRTALNFSQFPGISGGVISDFEFYSDTSAHLSARFGVAIRDTLLFASAGVGVSHSRSKLVRTGFGQTCTAAAFVPPNGFVCTQVAPVASLPTIGTSRWTPSGLVSIGIEQNFGRMFGRISGEVEGADGGDFWVARGKAEVGMRF